MTVTTLASIVIDGFQNTWSPYSIRGQMAKFREEGMEEKQEGWYLVPGKVDKISYLLLVFFVLIVCFLMLFEHMI